MFSRLAKTTFTHLSVGITSLTTGIYFGNKKAHDSIEKFLNETDSGFQMYKLYQKEVDAVVTTDVALMSLDKYYGLLGKATPTDIE